MKSTPTVRADAARNRESLLAAAEQEFAERGLSASVADIARRAGVAKGTVFRHFATKEDLLEAVYERVYLGRLSADWPTRMADRSTPLRTRLLEFYTEYSGLIFEHDWMRIFMFSGLAGAALNHRYLEHLSETILTPVLAETAALATTDKQPTMEDIWNLHGGIVYIGIRKHIYGLPTPDCPDAAIANAIDKYLSYFDIGYGKDASPHMSRSDRPDDGPPTPGD